MLIKLLTTTKLPTLVKRRWLCTVIISVAKVALRKLYFARIWDLNHPQSKRRRKLRQYAHTLEDTAEMAREIYRGDVRHRLVSDSPVTSYDHWVDFYEHLEEWDVTRLTVRGLREIYDSLRGELGSFWDLGHGEDNDTLAEEVGAVMGELLCKMGRMCAEEHSTDRCSCCSRREEVSLILTSPEKMLYDICCYWHDVEDGEIVESAIRHITHFCFSGICPHLSVYRPPEPLNMYRSHSEVVGDLDSRLETIEYYQNRSAHHASVLRKRRRDIQRLLYTCCRRAPELAVGVVERTGADPHADGENAFWLLVSGVVKKVRYSEDPSREDFVPAVREWLTAFSPHYETLLHRSQVEKNGAAVLEYCQSLQHRRSKPARRT